jgi:hypothetical protein
MSRFASKLRYEDEDDGTFRLAAPLVYTTNVLGDDRTIIVPEGFVTDLYSVPKALQWFVARIQSSTAPAVVHDFLYSTVGDGARFTRDECDEVLLEAMRDRGISWWDRSRIYAGVRLGGWLPWSKCVAAWKAQQPKPMTDPANVGRGVQP